MSLSERTQLGFSGAYKYLAPTVTNSLLSPVENIKKINIKHFIDHDSRRKHDN